MPYSPPSQPKGWGHVPFLRVLMHVMRLSTFIKYSILNYNYSTHYVLRMIITMRNNNENANEQIGELISDPDQ